jgi:hypothetical protein
VKRISKVTVRKFGELVAAVLVSLADRRITPQEGAAIILKAGAFIAALREDLDMVDSDDDDDAS